MIIKQNNNPLNTVERITWPNSLYKILMCVIISSVFSFLSQTSFHFYCSPFHILLNFPISSLFICVRTLLALASIHHSCPHLGLAQEPVQSFCSRLPHPNTLFLPKAMPSFLSKTSLVCVFVSVNEAHSGIYRLWKFFFENCSLFLESFFFALSHTIRSEFSITVFKDNR